MPDGQRQIYIPPPSAKVSSVQHIRLSLRVDYKPYWSDELGELQTVLNALFLGRKQNPIHLQQAEAKFLIYKLEAQRKSWRNKTASVNLELDGRYL